MILRNHTEASITNAYSEVNDIRNKFLSTNKYYTPVNNKNLFYIQWYIFISVFNQLDAQNCITYL